MRLASWECRLRLRGTVCQERDFGPTMFRQRCDSGGVTPSRDSGERDCAAYPRSRVAASRPCRRRRRDSYIWHGSGSYQMISTERPSAIMAERIAPASWIKGQCSRVAQPMPAGHCIPRQVSLLHPGSSLRSRLCIKTCPCAPLSKPLIDHRLLRYAQAPLSLPEASLFPVRAEKGMAVGSNRPARSVARAAARHPIGCQCSCRRPPHGRQIAQVRRLTRPYQTIMHTHPARPSSRRLTASSAT
jgi:hypothetical protein